MNIDSVRRGDAQAHVSSEARIATPTHNHHQKTYS